MRDLGLLRGCLRLHMGWSGHAEIWSSRSRLDLSRRIDIGGLDLGDQVLEIEEYSKGAQYLS